MPVATAPATEMCGSEARLASAHPSACRWVATSPYRRAAATVTRRRSRSMLISGGSPARLTRSPSVSPSRLKECPLPTARTRRLPATSRRSSSTLVGRWYARAEYRTFPAQFRRGTPPPVTPSPPVAAPSAVTAPAAVALRGTLAAGTGASGATAST